MNDVLEKINIADSGLNLLSFVAKNIYVLPEEDEDTMHINSPAKRKRLEKKRNLTSGGGSEDIKQSQKKNIENVEEVVPLPEEKKEKEEEVEGSPLPTKKFKQKTE